MNIRDFEYLLALSEQGSFSRAAAFCGVSQPALSIQMKKFEEELGVELIERGSRQMVWTEAGKATLVQAKVILDAVQRTKLEAEVLKDPYAGTITLGAFPTLAPYFFPKIVQDLVDSYPNLRFHLVEEKTEILLERLHQGTLDAAFLALPEDHEALEFAPLFEEEFLLAVPARHQWAQLDFLNSDELDAQRLLLLEEGHCLRGQALDFCHQQGATETIDFRASSLPTLLQMVAMGQGISLIPECAVNADPNISYIRLEHPVPKREIGLFWRKTSLRQMIFEEIVDDFGK